MYKLVLDRMVGLHHLHPKVAIACAGNKDTDNAITEPMSTAMQTRLVHMELTLDHLNWIDWFSDAGGDHRIGDQIKFKPDLLYTFRPDHTDHTYACPRTWEFASRILSLVEPDDPDTLPLLAGTLSEGVAREFVTFMKIYDKLPKVPQILANPATAKIPDEPSFLYALTGTLAQNASLENFNGLMKYITRMPVEFQVVTLRDTVRRNKKLAAHEATRAWIANAGATLF